VPVAAGLAGRGGAALRRAAAEDQQAGAGPGARCEGGEARGEVLEEDFVLAWFVGGGVGALEGG